MILSPQTWLKWAAKLMPPSRKDWLAAMQNELEQISGPAEQNVFAYGCFKTALLEGARSRKGLSWVARSGGAAALFAFSAVLILWGTKNISSPETLAFAKLMTVLAVFYALGAALIMASLKALKIYAGIGFCIAALMMSYLLSTAPSYAYLSSKYLAAISFEAAGAMATLFMASLYLNWLYDPAIHDV